MVDATHSACINHPAIEATGRCKQCGRPMCDACTVTGPTGRFCGEPCERKHEAFVQRARELEARSASRSRSLFGVRLRALVGGLLKGGVLAAVVLGVGYWFEVPVLHAAAEWLLELLGQ